MRGVLAVLDLLCSIPAALGLLAVLASLTCCSAGAFGIQSRRARRSGPASRRARARPEEDGLMGQLCAFVLKGYGFALLVGVLFRDLGGLVAACVGGAVLAIG